MDAYTAYLESVLFSPGPPCRGLSPLLDGSDQVFTFRELLCKRLEYLAWAVPGEEGDEMREEVKKLRKMISGLVETFSSR